MKKILIFGCGEISDAISKYYFEKAFEIEGYVLNHKYIDGKFFKTKKIYQLKKLKIFFHLMI